jgi:hypothetical protein
VPFPASFDSALSDAIVAAFAGIFSIIVVWFGDDKIGANIFRKL